MSPSNVPNGPSLQSTGRKRPSQGRIVPAIPLALTKPKQAKTTTGKTDADGKDGIQSTTTQNVVEVSNGDGGRAPGASTFLPSAPGESQPPQSLTTLSSPDLGINGITSSSAHSNLLDSASSTTMTAPLHSYTDASPSETQAEMISSPSTAKNVAASSPQRGIKSPGQPDLRSIRTALPPAFIPSSERQTPESASPRALRDNHPSSSARTHHPSTGSIVFGGRESASSSPAPLHSAASSHSQAWPVTHVAPTPTHSVLNHAHRTSEPYAAKLPPPPSFLPSGTHWSTRQGYPQYVNGFHPPAYPTFRYPPRELFTPADEHAPNGLDSRSRSGSQASSAAVRHSEDLQSPSGPDRIATPSSATFRDPRPTGFSGPPQLRQQHPYATAPPQTLHPELVQRMENAEALRVHVLSHFGHPALSDCHLQIREAESGTRHYLDAHKIILSRSSTLLDCIRSSEPPSSASLQTQVHVSLQGRYIRIKPLLECIRYLYGGPLSSLSLFNQPSTPSEPLPTNGERMVAALQLVATASWLHLDQIVARAMSHSLTLLHWDTISAALAFALDGGLAPTWNVDDGSDLSCSSSDDSLGRHDGSGTPTYDPYATDLLHRIVDFTVHLFPPNFYLDASAPQLASCPRLPPLPAHESRSLRSDPRLSQIRFGEIPAEDHNRPSAVTTTISSLLLSLPFPLLKCILEHHDLVFQLGADTVASIMRQVVAEREVRRKKVLQARQEGITEANIDAHVVQNLFYEEEVVPSAQHRAGFRLARRRKGMDTPPSSGANSDQIK